jgi:hypothetical protein
MLHQVSNGEGVERLNVTKLANLRRDLKTAAGNIRRLMQQHGISTSSWKDVEALDKEYYAILLEQTVSNSFNMNISKCRRKWCAMALLQESFKPSRQSARRRSQRREVCWFRRKIFIEFNSFSFV